MINAVVSVTSTTPSSAIIVNDKNTGKNPIGLTVDFDTGTGVGTQDVEGTYNSIAEINAGTAVWIRNPDVSGTQASYSGYTIAPYTAVRLHMTAYTSGTIYLRVKQSGG